jgi:hypothetical protein
MDLKPPTPVCRSFTVCRQVIQDQFTQEWVLVAPTHQIASVVFPMVATVSLFVRCTSVHGAYRLELQLQDLEGEKLWNHKFDPLMESHDPLGVALLNLHHVGIYFPKPGKYELVLLANDAEVVRDVFWARLHPQVVQQQ